MYPDSREERGSDNFTPPQDTMEIDAPPHLDILLYDEHDHDLTPDKNTWPPAGPNIDLSSFWVMKVVAADFIPKKVRYAR